MHYCLKHLQTTVAQYNIIPLNLTFCKVLNLQKQIWPAHWMQLCSNCWRPKNEQSIYTKLLCATLFSNGKSSTWYLQQCHRAEESNKVKSIQLFTYLKAWSPSSKTGKHVTDALWDHVVWCMAQILWFAIVWLVSTGTDGCEWQVRCKKRALVIFEGGVQWADAWSKCTVTLRASSL